MIPDLPVEAVRQAVADGDWPRASALVEAHDRALRDAFADPANPPSRAHCEALLVAQRALSDELAILRDEASAQLQRLQRESRGVRAYLKAGE